MSTRNSSAELQNFKDESLAVLAKNSDADAAAVLILRYFPVVRSCIRAGTYPGLELDDLMQEGMLGLISAVQTFDASRNVSFKTYARICISSKISTALTAWARQKHMPLNRSISLEDADFLVPALPDSPHDPVMSAISNENMLYIQKQMRLALSCFEQDVFRLYLHGHSYSEIAVKLSTSSKSVGNALQRVRRKLRLAWEQHANG